MNPVATNRAQITIVNSGTSSTERIMMMDKMKQTFIHRKKHYVLGLTDTSALRLRSTNVNPRDPNPRGYPDSFGLPET